MDLHQLCQQAVGNRIRYTGTNGDERDEFNHGLPLEGEGDCVEYHDSHGLCLIVLDPEGTRLCVDPNTIEIIPKLSSVAHETFLYHDSLNRIGECFCDTLLGERLVVIFTELKKNSGPSVTNCVEDIIEQFCANYKVSQKDIQFIERYEDRPEELDEIICRDNKEPTWRRLSKYESQPIIEALK